MIASRERPPIPARPFSPKERIRSFAHALRGIGSMIRSEHNARIHAGAMTLSIVLGIWLGLDHGEWLALFLAIGLVWVAESLNTAIETLCDVVSLDHDPGIKRAKDIAAGGVLWSAACALAVGLWIFAPRLLLVYSSMLND